MKIVILLLFCLLTGLVVGDCLFSHYPRMLTVGHVQAHVGRDESQHDTDLLYDYPLAQIIKINDISEAQKHKNFMISVNGLETIRTQPYQQTKFSVEAVEAKVTHHSGQKLITSVAFKITVASTPSSNNQRRYNWNYVKLNFVYSYNPQLFVGQVRSPEILPSGDKEIYRVRGKFPKRAPQTGFNIKAITPKIFLTALHIQQLPFNTDNYGFDIEGTIQKIENLRKYAWNPKIINKLKKVLTDQKIPSLSIQDIKVYEKNRGQSDIFQLNFNIKTTTSLKLLAFSYSYMFYLEKSDDRGQQNHYQIAQGQFIARNNDVIFYQGIQNTGMLLLGFNGYRTSYANINQYDEFGFDIQYGDTGTSQKRFLHIRAKNKNSEFFFEYFGIEIIPRYYCSDCMGSPYLYQGQFCVSECPDGYVHIMNEEGYNECIECEIDKYLVADYRTNTCRCPRRFYYITPTNTCQQCPQDCQTCNGNRCLTCDRSRILNIQTSRCQCRQTNQHGLAYYKNNQGQCQRCHQTCKTCFGSKPNQCISCKNGRILTQQRYCGCKQNFKEDSYKICQCLPPYLYYGNQCTITNNKCGQNEQFFLNPYSKPACTCIPGYFKHSIANICMEQCKNGLLFSYQNNQCQCPDNMAYHSDTQTCIDCTSKPNQFYNKQTKQCDCINADYSYDPYTHQCVKCPQNQYFDFKKGQCSCIFNFYKYGNQCIRCQSSNQGNHCHTTKLPESDYGRNYNFNIGNSRSNGNNWGFQSIYNKMRMLF